MALNSQRADESTISKSARSERRKYRAWRRFGRTGGIWNLHAGGSQMTARLKESRPRTAIKSLIAGAICATAILAYRPCYAGEQNACQRMDVTEVRSPDGRWTARVYGRICDLGIEMSAAVVVDIGHSRGQRGFVTVLGIDMPSNKALWPELQWVSPTVLSIKVPADAGIGLQMARLQDIKIRVKFCPNKDRHRWLAYKAAYREWLRKLEAWIRAEKKDPSAAGPKPPRPAAPESIADLHSCKA
jgi:hypothetical protein